eukprot:31310-Pelagococcus_subviridis.AAC.8
MNAHSVSRVVPYERTSGWSSKASDGVERHRGRGLNARDPGRRDAPGKRARRHQLRQLRRRRGGALRVHGEVLRVPQRQPREVFHALRLRRAEAQRLSPLREVLQDGGERRREAHVEDAVRLVQHEDPDEGRGRVHAKRR